MVAIYCHREPLMSHQYTPSDEMFETHRNGNTSPGRESAHLPIRCTCDGTCPNAGGIRSHGSGSGVTEAVESNQHGTSDVLAPYRHRAAHVAPSENAGRVTAEIEDGSPTAASDGVAASGPGHHARRCGIGLPPEARVEQDQRGAHSASLGHSLPGDGRGGTVFATNCGDVMPVLRDWIADDSAGRGTRFPVRPADPGFGLTNGRATKGHGFALRSGLGECRGRKWRHDRRELRERTAVPGAAYDYRRPARTNPRVTPSAAGGVCGR
jgi:hypothetical protein